MTFYFQKGLHVEAEWGFLNPDSKRKIKKKVLRGLTFLTTVIEGEVEDVRDVGVEVRGVPQNEQQWPGYNPPDRNRPPGTSEKERVRPRNLKLRFIEDVTKVRNDENEESDMIIADGAVRESHLEAIRAQFTHHELIKVRILGESKDNIDAAAHEICEATGCDLITRTGHMAVLYRPQG